VLAIASVRVVAGSIDPNDASVLFETLGTSSSQEKRFLTEPIFDFSPFSANNHTVVPGFADPLGTGIDPGLKVFAGKVQFMDLLGDYNVARNDRTAEIELPYGTMRADDLLSSFLSRYLEHGRAFDQSLMSVQNAQVTERNGLPVTTETSPLTLAGFGSVADNLKPFFLHWTACPGRDKRDESMAKSKELRRPACSAPGVCICSNI